MNVALCTSVPSFRVMWNSRHVPAQAALVCQPKRVMTGRGAVGEARRGAGTAGGHLCGVQAGQSTVRVRDTYRVIAGRLLSGKVIGNFRYDGTRPDDPNDIVPHEHRRELRALRVFGAWTNLTDLKAGNTLDTLVTENGQRDRQALPAGRRLDLRHAQRLHEWDLELGALLRGRPT